MYFDYFTMYDKGYVGLFFVVVVVDVYVSSLASLMVSLLISFPILSKSEKQH